MVEGPGATRNGRKVQAVVGMVLENSMIALPSVLAPKTKVADTSTNTSRGGTCTIHTHLEGRRLDFAVSVGKELFLVFGSLSHSGGNENKTDPKPMALRLHFGMNGVLNVRKQNESSKLAPWRKNDPSISTLWFRKITSTSNSDHSESSTETRQCVVEIVASTLTLVSAAVACSKFARLKDRDVCGSDFNHLAVLESISRKQTFMICDALLDQELYPGVGNIIKVEGLHRAGVHPRRLVKNLTRVELIQTILECRSYAMAWLSSGRSGSKKVYNQRVCGFCQKGRVRMVKMGHSKRVTFWCESCQPFIPRDESATIQKSASNIPPQAEPTTTTLREKPALSEATNGTVPRPFCPLHGSKKLVLRRVRNKQSANLHRLFRTCRSKGCQYFSWADSHLPSCGCAKTSILRVSKTERTGGRWFLSCATATTMSKTSVSSARSVIGGGRSGSSIESYENNLHHRAKSSKLSCSFFQWATNCQLAPLADELSPLT